MTHRITRAFLAATLGALALVTWLGAQVRAQSGPPACGTEMRVLVISADGGEADLPAITTALGFNGTPYDVYLASEHPTGLSGDALASGCRAHYQGVILTTNVALSTADLQTLSAYEAAFGVRQVTWYTWPTPDVGFTWATEASDSPSTLTPTPAGAEVFPYLRTGAGSSPLVVQDAWTYHATPLDGSTTPLLTDADGHALAAVRTYTDGRENLAMTFDSNAYQLHAVLLSYGVVNWVTRGLFIGDRHTYASPQIDDLLIDDGRWLPSTPCGTDVDATGAWYRISGADLTAVADWQTRTRLQPITAGFRITMAFNGLGATSDYDHHWADTLTPAAQELQQHFYWANHTFDHENLDAISYGSALTELTMNNSVAAGLGLQDYSRLFMVQPDVSGLSNPDFLRAAYDTGLRLLISDTSKPGQDNPTPNTGRWNALGQPGLFVIPRRANNLFFNVVAPADWTAEYNCLYRSYWGRDLTYDEILETVSDELLLHLLRGEIDPWMFHQSNLGAYDGVHTLLTDLLDRTFAKYGTYVTFPILSPSVDVVGDQMMNRTAIRTSGISGLIRPGVGIDIVSPVDAVVPVTGVRLADSELYNGQWISWIPVAANRTVTVPLSSQTTTDSSANTYGIGTRTITITTTSPGELLVAFVSSDGPSSSPQTMTVSGGGLAWSLVTRVNSQGGGAEIWAAVAPSPLTNAAIRSVQAYGSFRQLLTVIAFQGAAGVGASATAAGPVGAPAVGLTTTAAGSLIYGVGFDWSNASPRTLGPAQVMVREMADPGWGDFWVQALATPVPAAATGVVLNDTAPVNSRWNLAAVEILPAAPPVTVPNVVNFTQSAAISALQAAGLTPGAIATAPSATVAAGLIISSDPASGTKVAGGTAVALVVSSGPPLVIPTVVGQLEADAVGTLAGAGLNASVTTAYDATVGAGRVISQDPPAGAQAAAGQVVALVVSLGPSASTPTVDVTFSSDGTNTRTVSVTTTGPNRLLIAFVAADGPASRSQTATVSGGGLAWTLVRRSNAQHGTSEIWRATAAGALTGASIRSTLQQRGYDQSFTVVAFVGAGGIGTSAIAGAASGAPTVSLVTTAASSLVYGVGNDWDHAVARTLGPDQTMVHQWVDTRIGDTYWVQAVSTYAGGTVVQIGCTAPTGDRWNLAAVEILR